MKRRDFLKFLRNGTGVAMITATVGVSEEPATDTRRDLLIIDTLLTQEQVAEIKDRWKKTFGNPKNWSVMINRDWGITNDFIHALDVLDDAGDYYAQHVAATAAKKLDAEIKGFGNLDREK